MPNQATAELVTLEERGLLPRYARGDQRAFEALMRRYQAAVYGYLVRCGVPPHARDDLFQDIFCRVHAAASSYNPDQPLKPWIFTVVANVVRTWHRKQRIHLLVYPDQPLELPDPAPSSQQLAESRETAAWLEESLSKLPLAQREVVVLACVEQLELQEIAGILELPVNTVKTHLRRARIALARVLAGRRQAFTREVLR